MPMIRRDAVHPPVRDFLTGFPFRSVDPSSAKSLSGVARRGDSQAEEWSSMAVLVWALSGMENVYVGDLH